MNARGGPRWPPRGNTARGTRGWNRRPLCSVPRLSPRSSRAIQRVSAGPGARERPLMRRQRQRARRRRVPLGNGAKRATAVTTASVAKKFQCLPYSPTGTWYPVAAVERARMAARSANGTTCLPPSRLSTGPSARRPTRRATTLATRHERVRQHERSRADVHETTPNVSVLPRRRGRLGNRTRGWRQRW